jgi:transcriptional regulator with XRE-family HTH domain
MNIGPMIRSYRKKQKLTLKAVAEKAHVSEGFLSQVENNVNSPSVDTLIKICNAVGVNAGDLLNKVENQERQVVIRKHDHQDIDIPNIGFATKRFLSPENRTVIDSGILVIEPGKSIPVRKGVKNAQEVLCVLEGTAELIHSAGNIRLEEGDAVHFFSDPKDQSVKNIGTGQVKALWIGTI